MSVLNPRTLKELAMLTILDFKPASILLSHIGSDCVTVELGELGLGCKASGYSPASPVLPTRGILFRRQILHGVPFAEIVLPSPLSRGVLSSAWPAGISSSRICILGPYRPLHSQMLPLATRSLLYLKRVLATVRYYPEGLHLNATDSWCSWLTIWTF